MSSNRVSDEDIRAYYDAALALVIACGSPFMEGYQQAKADFEVKGANYDLVTIYDKKIEEALIKGLLAAFPESRIIGEESAARAELSDAPTWIIDPIDGTTNFIHRIPQCCISVGLAINKELVVGIVYSPPAKELFSASRGYGAYLNGKRIHASIKTKMSQSVIAYEISLINIPGTTDKNIKRVYKLGSRSIGTRSLGSAAVTLCYIAAGRLDVYHVEDLQSWDLAGGVVILREAGGVVYHTNGGEYNIMKPDCVCAATKELAQEAIDIIEEANNITAYTLE